jgi:hypothetical protein
MTTLPTTLENNNILSDHHTDDYDRNCMSMKEVYERTSSSSSEVNIRDKIYSMISILFH